MNLMAKLAIGTFATALIGAAAVICVFNVMQCEANANKTGDLRPAPSRAATDGTERQLAQAAAQANGSTTANLPGGASSLQENYQDWVVVCAQQTGADAQSVVKRCAMNQQQVNQKGGQRVLALELRPAGSAFDATLFLPFGLALDKGVTLQVDGGQVTQTYRFRTCIPAGCVVPLNFDAAFMASLEKGSTLKINAVADGGTDTPLSISLKGFGAASARLGALAK